MPGGCLQGCQSLRFSSPADFCSSNAERKTCLQEQDSPHPSKGTLLPPRG